MRVSPCRANRQLRFSVPGLQSTVLGNNGPQAPVRLWLVPALEFSVSYFGMVRLPSSQKDARSLPRKSTDMYFEYYTRVDNV
jgi:hypothetical protein